MALEQYTSQQLLVAALISLLTILILRWWNQNRKLPPGPWGLPLLGYYPFISPLTYEDYLILSKKYGSVFSFRTIGGRLLIILNGAKTIKEVLQNRAEEFIGRPPGNNVVSWLSKGIGITQEEGEPWIEHRKFFMLTGKNFGFGKPVMEQKIQDEINLMLSNLRQDAGKVVNIKYHIGYVNNCIISQFLFSKRFKKDQQFGEILSYMSRFVEMFIGKRNLLIGLVYDFYFWLKPSMTKGRDDMRHFTDAIVEEQERTFDPQQTRGYVDAFLQQREEQMKRGKKDGGSYTMERLEANTMNLFFEGTESVSNTTTSMLQQLSKYPEVQKKIEEELDTVVGSERLPSWADRPKLPYLDATLQELYRIAAAFLVTTMYSNFKETTIEGYRIPKRSAIVANLASINFDPKIYPDPHKFDPNRFLNAEGRRIKKEGPYPFGLGKRACIGEALAQMEVFLVISSLVQSYTLYPGNDEETLKIVPKKLVV